MAFHDGEYVLCLETIDFASEHGNVVCGNVDTRLAVVAAIEPSKLIKCTNVGNATQQSDARNGSPVPLAAQQPEK